MRQTVDVNIIMYIVYILYTVENIYMFGIDLTTSQMQITLQIGETWAMFRVVEHFVVKLEIGIPLHESTINEMECISQHTKNNTIESIWYE